MTLNILSINNSHKKLLLLALLLTLAQSKSFWHPFLGDAGDECLTNEQCGKFESCHGAKGLIKG